MFMDIRKVLVRKLRCKIMFFQLNLNILPNSFLFCTLLCFLPLATIAIKRITCLPFGANSDVRLRSASAPSQFLGHASRRHGFPSMGLTSLCGDLVR